MVCADHSFSWKRAFDGKDTAEIDASIVATHMILEATDLGLNSIWVGYFKPDVIKAEFALPEGVEPINILGIGYSDEERKSLTDTIQNANPLQKQYVMKHFDYLPLFACSKAYRGFYNP